MPTMLLTQRASLQLVFLHGAGDLFEANRGKDIGLGIGIPAIAGAEAPEFARTGGPLQQKMRVLGIDAHRKSLDADRPDPRGSLRVLNGQLSLNPASTAAQQAAVGAGVRAAGVCPHDIGEEKQQQSPKSDFATEP